MASVDEYDRLGPEAAARLSSHPSPDVLAATFLFFASVDSNYVTGRVLAADGGATACFRSSSATSSGARCSADLACHAAV